MTVLTNGSFRRDIWIPDNATESCPTQDDYFGLAARLGHVRIGSYAAAELLNFTECRATTFRPSGGDDGQAEASARIRTGQRCLQMARSDAGEASSSEAGPTDRDGCGVRNSSSTYSLLKEHVQMALRAGLKVVLNPLHLVWSLDINEQTLRWVWATVLEDFPLDEFPADKVAFEMINEPGQWGTHAPLPRPFSRLLPGLVSQIHAAQPSRLVILPGEMGRRCDREPSMPWYLSSSEGLLLDAEALNQFVSWPHPVAATFHYYDPRSFTAHTGVIDETWEVEESADMIHEKFASIRAAIKLPVYLGETGVNIDFVHKDHAVDWILTVRDAAERNQFQWAYWVYQTGLKRAVTHFEPETRLREWDCSPMLTALFGRQLNTTSESDCPDRNEQVPFVPPTGVCDDMAPGLRTQYVSEPSVFLPARPWAKTCVDDE